MRLHEPLGPPYTKKSDFFNERILINGRRRLSKHAPRHLPPIFFFNRARFRRERADLVPFIWVLLLEPSSRSTSSGGVPWEPGFKTQLVTSLRSPGRGHAQDMAGPWEDGGCMRFWEARSRTGRRGSRRRCDDRWCGKRPLRRLCKGSTPVDDGNAAKNASESNGQ